MRMNLYLWIGIGLAALAGAVLIVPAAWFLRTVQRRENTPAYLKRIPRVRYAPGMEKIIKDGYRVSGSIEGMLLVAAAYSGRRARKRLYAASSYLKESRYKDYETALYKAGAAAKTDDRQAARCFYALRQGEREEL